MRYALRVQERALWTSLAHRHLPALLCALATVLSLTLSACAGIVRSADCGTPTPQLPNRSSPYAGNVVPRKPPSYAPAVTLPIVGDGVVYVAYAIPHEATGATGNPAQAQPQYAVAALRARDGLPLWRVLTAIGTRPLAVADGVLIISDNGSGGLIGLRASDGTTLWHTALSAEFMTPSGGVLYMIAGSAVYALRFTDGHVLWQSAKGGPILTPPVVDGTAVYVGEGNGSVEALQTDTGAVRWTAFPGSTPSPNVWYIPLAVFAGQLYVKTSGERAVKPAILRLNPVNGSNEGYALRLPTNTRVLLPVLLASVFYAVLLGAPPEPPATIAAYRLSASGGELLWRVPVQVGVFRPTSMAHDAQTLDYADYTAAPHGVISAFRLADGAVLWQQQALDNASMGIVVDAGYLFEAGFVVDDSCHAPPVHPTLEIRALRSADGGVAWTQLLNATL